MPRQIVQVPDLGKLAVPTPTGKSVHLGEIASIELGPKTMDSRSFKTNGAPSLILFSLLGMDQRAAFPIMMGSGAFGATVAGVRFAGAGRFHGRAALGLTVGGIPAVIIAAWLVRSLPLGALRWLVLVVVAYTSATLLRAGLREAA